MRVLPNDYQPTDAPGLDLADLAADLDRRGIPYETGSGTENGDVLAFTAPTDSMTVTVVVYQSRFFGRMDGELFDPVTGTLKGSILARPDRFIDAAFTKAARHR